MTSNPFCPFSFFSNLMWICSLLSYTYYIVSSFTSSTPGSVLVLYGWSSGLKATFSLGTNSSISRLKTLLAVALWDVSLWGAPSVRRNTWFLFCLTASMYEKEKWQPESYAILQAHIYFLFFCDHNGIFNVSLGQFSTLTLCRTCSR